MACFRYVSNGKKYFFHDSYDDNHGLGRKWVDVHIGIPQRVVPRPGLEDGLVDTLEKYKSVLLSDQKEIKNPLK